MSMYELTSDGVTPDDVPVDVADVGNDDRLIEQLRRSLSPDDAVIWDDDDETDDAAARLLRAFQLDLSLDLPVQAVRPSEVTPLAPRQRRLGRGATVTAVAFGVLSVAGVAAAASSPSHPFAAVRNVVSSAVSSVVHAVTPGTPERSRPGAAVRPTPSPTAISSLASATDPASSKPVAQQVQDTLDKAARFLAAGQAAAARAQLTVAARKLALVTDPGLHAKLAAELAALVARLPATPAGNGSGPPQHQPAQQPSTDPGKGHSNGNGNGNGNEGSSSHDTGHPGHGKDSSRGSTTGSSDGRTSGPDGQNGPKPSASTGSDSSNAHHPKPAVTPDSGVKGNRGGRAGGQDGADGRVGRN